MIIISDTGASREASSREEAAEIIREWYGHLVEQEKLDELPPFRPLEEGEELQEYADYVCDTVATALGYKPWVGHGNYYVSAASEAGLRLEVIEEEEEGENHIYLELVPFVGGAPGSSMYMELDMPIPERWAREILGCENAHIEVWVHDVGAGRHFRSFDDPATTVADLTYQVKRTIDAEVQD